MTTNKALTNKDDKDNYYTAINLKVLHDAMKNLTHKGLLLWLYLAKNQDGYKQWLSCAEFLEWANCGKSSFYNAFEELVKLKYLIPVDSDKEEPKIWNFYEESRMENEKIEVTINKKR